MEPTPESIRNVLKSVKYPGFTRDIVSFGIVKDIDVKNSKVSLFLLLPKPDSELQAKIEEAVKEAVLRIEGISEVDIQVEAREPRQTRAEPERAQPKLAAKYIIAVASGKGGVGKSTVAVNLALGIEIKGKKVGLMDADIYGPSLPIMMGVHERPMANPQTKKIIPMERYDLKMMSIGFLVDEDDVMIWRGPMVHGAVKQFIEDVDWTGVEYLVVDLPPGTGDAQLSLIQTVPLTGGIIVTTPQDVALIDVKRGVQMFRKLNVPVLGVVENMSYLSCPHCQGEVDIFNRGGGKRMAEAFSVPFLGEIPIDPEIRVGGDRGEPIVIAHPENPAAQAFLRIAENIIEVLGS